MSNSSWPSTSSATTVTASGGPYQGQNRLPSQNVSPVSQGNYVPLQTISCHSSGQNRQSGTTAIPPTKEEVEKRPWQYEGYPGFTKWMASSPDFFLLRRFNRLNAWVQLDWQDEIVRLETELEQINKESWDNRGPSTRCSSVRPKHDPKPRRREILRELRPLLKEYNEFILSYSQIRDRSTAEDFQVNNVKHWFRNHRTAVDKEEADFIEKGTDVIPLIEKKKSFLRLLIEKIGPERLTRFFPARSKKGRVESQWTKYSSNKKIDVVMTVILVVVGLATLLGPMWWLNFVDNDAKRLGIISGFIILFACILASATVQQPFEVMAGTAAYAAVLVVFLQQSGSESTCGSRGI